MQASWQLTFSLGRSHSITGSTFPAFVIAVLLTSTHWSSLYNMWTRIDFSWTHPLPGNHVDCIHLLFTSIHSGAGTIWKWGTCPENILSFPSTFLALYQIKSVVYFELQPKTGLTFLCTFWWALLWWTVQFGQFLVWYSTHGSPPPIVKVGARAPVHYGVGATVSKQSCREKPTAWQGFDVFKKFGVCLVGRPHSARWTAIFVLKARYSLCALKVLPLNPNR